MSQNSSSSDDEEEETSSSDDEQTSGSDSEKSFSFVATKPQPEPKKSLTAPPQSATKPQPEPKKSLTAPPQSATKPQPEPKKSLTAPPQSATRPQPEPKKSLTAPPQSATKPQPEPKKALTAPPQSATKPKPEPKKSVTAPPQSATKPQPPPELSESEVSGSDTDSDSDSPPKKPAVVDLNVKPISSKPMEQKIPLKSVKNDGSKPISTSPPAKPLAKSKRSTPAPADTEKDAKKAKPNTTNREVKKAAVSSSQFTQPASKPQVSDVSVSESEESVSSSDADTDSDSPPKKFVATGSNVKPISSKPMQSKSAKISESKTVATSSPAKSKLPTPAATNEKDAKKDVKKARKNSAQDEDTKKQLFQRLWSKDDEIVILKGMIDYKNENDKSPIADIGAFHEFIKKSFHVDVNKTQLADKIRRLKKKYVNNASRQQNGIDRSFTIRHEQKLYELSKLIWGSNSGTESEKKQSKKNGNSKGTAASTSTGAGADADAGASLVKSNGVDDQDTVMTEADKKVDISRFVRYGGMSDSPIVSEEIMKGGLELVDGSKRVELETKWRKLKELELELYVKRMELMREQALVVLEAVRSSGN